MRQFAFLAQAQSLALQLHIKFVGGLEVGLALAQEALFRLGKARLESIRQAGLMALGKLTKSVLGKPPTFRLAEKVEALHLIGVRLPDNLVGSHGITQMGECRLDASRHFP